MTLDLALLRRVAGPLLAGLLLGALVDPFGLPYLGTALGRQQVVGRSLVGQSPWIAVSLLDGQAYFGRLEDSPFSNEIVLSDAYYFQDAKQTTTNTSVGLVHRGGELHAPVGGMRINRSKVLAIESIALSSEVAQAILADRALRGVP